MSQEPDLDTSVTVSTGGVTAVKSFAADEFPVPAIKFVLTNETEDSADVRLVDEVPEAFPMESIGFHPDFEGDRWTAYRDHRVEYERHLDPGEEVVTVYGVRLDEEGDAAIFLTEPTLELESGGDATGAVDDILGRDTTQAVRDALAGEGEISDLDGESSTLDDEDFPDLGEADDADEITAESEADDADEITAESEAVDDEVEVQMEDDTDDEDDAEEALDAGDVPDDDDAVADDVHAVAVEETEGVASTTDVEEGDDATSVTDEAAGADSPEFGASEDRSAPSEAGIAAALASEIRAGTASEEDLAVIQEQLEVDVARSVDVRIRRLQSQTADLVAYTDALAEFLDENGTGQELVDGFREEVEQVSADLDDLDAAVSTAATDREELRSTVDETTESLDDARTRLEDHASRLDGFHDQLTTTDQTVDALDEEMGEVREDIATLDEDITSIGDDVETELDDVRTDLRDVRADVRDMRDELDELESFRERLSSAFGTE